MSSVGQKNHRRALNRHRCLALLTIYWIGWLLITHWRLTQLPLVSGLKIDKLAHFLGYSLLAFLVGMIWISGSRPGIAIRRGMRACGIVALAGMADELTQPYFGRSLQWSDYAADLLGGLLGLSIAAVLLISPRIGSRSNC